jgi:hypothetical protein
MRILPSAIALLIAFTIAYMATPRTSEELQAQVGVPCTCNWLQGTPVQFTQCLGTANMSSVTCTQVGSQCFIGGIATWVPDAPNCVYTGNTMGWITAVAGGSGGPAYFDPSATQPGIPWGVISANCAGIAFGAVMQVAHDTWTGNCVCVPNTPTITTVASALWTCDSV